MFYSLDGYKRRPICRKIQHSKLKFQNSNKTQLSSFMAFTTGTGGPPCPAIPKPTGQFEMNWLQRIGSQQVLEERLSAAAVPLWNLSAFLALLPPLLVLFLVRVRA